MLPGFHAPCRSPRPSAGHSRRKAGWLPSGRCQRAAYAIRRTRSALPHTERVPCCRHVSHTYRRRKMPGAIVAIRVRLSPRNGHAPPELTTQSWICTLEGVASPLTSAEALHGRSRCEPNERRWLHPWSMVRFFTHAAAQGTIRATR
eukprot:2358205-Prymnesium_polylepis.1